MPQFVSNNHKTMMDRLRKIFIYADVIGWPDAEVNLGHLAGLTEVNLRADAFVRLSTRQATVIEWQSEIHTREGCEGKDWFDYDEIAGRDELKRKLCARAGCNLVELWTLDMSDDKLEKMVWESAEASCLTNTAMDYLDGTKDRPAFWTPEKSCSFKKSDLGFSTNDLGFKTNDAGFAKSEGFAKTKTSWPKQKFGR